MTGHPDEERRELVRQWMEKADRDLAIAHLVLDALPESAEEIGFHLQQSVEKYLKGFLTSIGQQPPRTHDLQELRSVVAMADPELAEITEELRALNPFAVAYRYPGAEAEVGAEELRTLAAATESLRDAVIARMEATGPSD